MTSDEPVGRAVEIVGAVSPFAGEAGRITAVNHDEDTGRVVSVTVRLASSEAEVSCDVEDVRFLD